MKTALWELHKALYQRLSNDVALNERVTGVFDDVEEGTTFPYCTVGEPTVTPFETKTSYGENITVVLHCWSDYSGKRQSYDILNLMLQSLSKTPLTLGGGFSLFDIRMEQMQVITDIDGLTKHGIMRLRFFINN